jgi:LPXTG-motif cell wall-anchored protein
MPFATLAERGSRRATPCETLAMVRRMPVHRRRLAALVAAGLLAAPASALGQSAGDEQYQDPFSGQNGGSSSGGGSSSAPQPAAPASTPAPAAPAAAAPATPSAATQQPQLPRTGAETLLTALAGVGLVMAGVGLRLRLPADGG